MGGLDEKNIVANAVGPGRSRLLVKWRQFGSVTVQLQHLTK